MKAACTMLLGAALVLTALSLVRADDKAGKQQTLKGTITCAKCDLKMAAKCHTVIKVNDTVYWFDLAGNKKYHKDTCMEAKQGSVTGVVSEKDGKKWIKVSKVEYSS